MRTPEEIKKGLECCHTEDCDLCDCAQCPYAVKKRFTKTCDVEMGWDTLDYIEQLEAKVPKWISVEERLPENDGDVLIMTPTGVSIGYCNIYCGYWVDYINDDDDHITHWIPLPEPPKEDDK